MNNYFKSILAVLSILVILGGAYWKIEARADAKYALASEVKELTQSLNAYITEQRLENVLDKIWDIESFYRDTAMPDREKRKLEKLIIKRDMLIKKLEKME